MEENKNVTAEEPKVDNTVEKLKVKKPKMKKLKQDDEPIKVDLSKPQQTEDNVTKVDISENKPEVEEVTEEVKPVEEKQEETPVVQEITEEEAKEVEELVTETKEAIVEAQETGKELPENIQKLMNFMEETGGDLNDYVRLNRDYSDMDNHTLLREYYKNTKPHLTDEEISFMMDDQFSYDEEENDEKEIRRKKLALKEQVASAKAHLDGQKSKYYEEIKAGSKLTSEQQKAVDFFNRYNKEQESNKKIQEQNKKTFLNKTNEVFGDKFKGFEYNVGDKRFRFNVKDVDQVKEDQSDINNFVKRFLNKNSEIEDANGYHKSLFTATNADAIAKHFYEQGKADALKDSIAKSKNVNMDARQSHSAPTEAGGLKFRVLGEDNVRQNSEFKIRKRNK
jgi:hypothetical protein